MNLQVRDFTVNINEKVIEALRIIDTNKQGFVVVCDEERVVGVLTDGDIRRGLIKGLPITGNLSDFYTKNSKTVRISDGFEIVTELFKNEAINFLPILDDNGQLVNIITKDQMHALLLHDIHADLNYDFLSLDTSIIDHEIYLRPWGYYKTTVLNEYFQAKVISVKPGGQISLQSHDHREEYWIVVHGTGTVQLDQSIKSIGIGSTVFIPLGCKHRLTNTDEKESLIITEVQIGDYFGEDDIIRYEDVYGRV